MAKINFVSRFFHSGITLLLCLILSLLSLSCDRSEKSSQKSSGTTVTGPIIDMNLESGGVMAKLDMDGKSPESLAVIGDNYFENGKYVQAIDVYKKLIELNPKDVDAYNDLGLSLHYIKKSNEAVDTLKKGAQIDPKFQNIWLSLGFVLTQMARNDEAKSALQHTININPDTPQGQEAKKLLGYLK